MALLPLLVALGLAVKVVLLLALADVFFYGEELEKGTAAKAMLDGVPIAHHKLAYHYYEGGGFVVSHLKALAFWLVGPSYLAHKLVALFSIALVTWAGLALLRRHFSERAALWFGLLFVFAPESFQKLPLLSLGVHFDALLFLIWTLDLTLSIAFQREKRWRAFAALGLVAGLGTYVSYQVLPVAGFCGLVLAWRKPRLVFAPRGVLGLAGFAVGIAPLVWMYSLVGDAIFDIHGTALVGDADLGANSLRLREFLLSVFAERTPLELLQPVAWCTAASIAIGYVLLDREQERRFLRGPSLFLVAFVAFWLVTYCTSPFVQGHAYYYYYFNRFIPLWWAATALVAIWIARLRRSEDLMTQRLGLFLGSLLVAFGALSSWRVVSEGRPAQVAANWELLTRSKGYVYAPYFAKIKHHLEGTLEEKLARVSAFDDDPALLYPAIGEEFLTPAQLAPEGDPSFEALVRRLEAWRPEAVPELLRGLGPWLHARAGGDLVAALRAIEGFEERWRDPLREAVGRHGSGHVHALHAEQAIRAEVERGLGAPGGAVFLRGTGARLHAFFRIRPDRARAFVETLPEPARADLLRGYERAVELERLGSR